MIAEDTNNDVHQKLKKKTVLINLDLINLNTTNFGRHLNEMKYAPEVYNNIRHYPQQSG